MIFEKQIVNMYRGMLHRRCDDTETVFYFSEDDFPGLIKEEYAFRSSLGHTMQGYLYSYENPIDGRLVVFDHGFGGGHRAYMKEIEKLARHGYLVLAYDHTGCMESGGESPRGLAQSLCDLDDCLNTVGRDARFSGFDISVIGHSWGAFSTLNICALHPEVSRIVAISGFVSAEVMISTLFFGIMKGYRRAILKLEEETNPKYVKFNAIESLKDSKVRALLIYSENDTMCKRVHYDLLKDGLRGNENIKFLLLKNKGHNPNYTEDAVSYLGEFGKRRAKLLKNKNATASEKAQFVKSFDWHRMTEQDEKVWKEIFEHLDN